MVKAKNDPQTYGEMVASGSERKKNQLYRAESMALNEDKIKNILTATTAQLEAISEGNIGRKLSLRDDTDLIKQQSLMYLRACTTAEVTPTFSGLCRALGYTRQNVYYFVKNNPDHQTTAWLNLVNDAIAEALADAALHGAVHPIVSIFLLKHSGWHEDETSIFDSAGTVREGPDLDISEVLEKYSADLPDD